MIVYHRNNFRQESYPETEDHVRRHISSIASATDDEFEFYDQVKIETTQIDHGWRVYGELDRDPAYDYTVPEDFEMPGEDEYQRGFGERCMTPEELQEHLLKKEGLA
ncbi:hypothetical protein PBI_WOES_34 [Gordonia phage Woes]|uniref:Uncharacterized protein n=6 Tax=Woesvirus woes TaxID=1982751 RepID=A0A514A5Y7_9CAUD|nr:hypothetical protein BH793_gp79 [Gordonia phage Woes]QAX94318.1 hypothetical protein SEA_GUILLAUME_34 [Gordonia phage Guillaume]QAX95303.1 hypothetical protein SEA_HELLO_34 [Gordonia phage Hello]QBP30312.1 hypothetical protein SEA_JORMUNGANDR_34 [Gordonia phage Jormungandr]QDF16894.1 hypothetical protein SEA_TEAL_34 [Gordonia phage Teal]QDH48680.1 hypothetical protein SEA_NEWT_35 [Gordonia phage Newt]UVF60806.1 hypothetical protein SEA_STICKER17_34 [Gordonia phage Sticker17]UVK60272.1 hyp